MTTEERVEAVLDFIPVRIWEIFGDNDTEELRREMKQAFRDQIEDCARIADEQSKQWRMRATKADTDASKLNNRIFEAKALTAESIACRIRALATQERKTDDD